MITVRAIERAWGVLALKAPEFADVNDRIFKLVCHIYASFKLKYHPNPQSKPQPQP